MSFFLISFLISLLGISMMIMRKLFVLNHNANNVVPDFVIDVPNLEEVRDATNKNFKKYSYKALVVIIRSYVLTLDLLKEKYRMLKDKIRKIKLSKNTKERDIPEVKEANKVLSMISEYKTKIKNIRKKIKEEEGI